MLCIYPNANKQQANRDLNSPHCGRGRRGNATHWVIPPTLLFSKTKTLNVRLTVTFVASVTKRHATAVRRANSAI